MIDKEKYSTDKIVFLGLFVLSIVIASFIVSTKSAIKLTKPIELEYASLAVPVPQGWMGDEQWKYKDNAYSLTRVLRLSQSSTGYIIQCKYLLGFLAEAPEVVFAEKANSLEARIVDTYEFERENLKILWVHLENEDARLKVLYGIAKLPNQRFLTLEVHQDMSDKDIAGEIFTKIAKGIEFNDNKLLADGAKIVSELKSKGIADALEKHFAIEQSEYYQDFFLIKDPADNPLGFTSTSLTKSGDTNKPDIQGVTFYSLQQAGLTNAQITRLQSDNHFDKLLWKSENSGQIDGSKTAHLMFEDGVMITTKAAVSGQKKHKLSDAAIPDVIFELFLPQILNRFESQIVVDLIRYDGSIIPTVITKSKTDKNKIELKLLNDRNIVQQYHIDDNGLITKAILPNLKLVRTAKQQVLESFPQAQNFLLKFDELLK